MKNIIAMTIGAGVVFIGTISAMVTVGVVTSKVTEKVLEEIFDQK